MESESRIDACVECCVRDNDFSKKKVYRCRFCERWFCEKHIEPRLAFIRDLDAITKYPEIRVMLDNEWKRKDGHPDFAYTKIKFLELEIAEKSRNELIKQALDRMNRYYAKTNSKKPIKMPPQKESPFGHGATTITHENVYHYNFTVPAEVYTVKEYRERLNKAKTLEEVERIINEYYESSEKRVCEKELKKESTSEGQLHFIFKEKEETAKKRFKVLKGKIFFLGIMLAVSFTYVPAMEWASSLNIGEGILSYLPWAFVLAMCHELLHALAWWSFGYSAIPIPILVPPILGITIGEKPRRRRENFVVSVAPVLLTVSSVIAYNITGNQEYLVFGAINLAGMFYDFISIFF